jgi:signal transduction histidine kinase
MILTLLFSDVGELFGLAMGILYSGICFLFGGYAHQVQKAKAAREQNELMFSQLKMAHHQLQRYADQIASLAVEQERSRLARDLHDSVTQTVFSMNLAAQSAQLLLERQPSDAASQLLRIEALAASALREIQTLFLQLQPRAFIEDGLPAALRRLAAEHEARDGLQVTLELQGHRALGERVTVGLYSIAHEALINVSKHSGTCAATVRLHLEEESAWMEIRDHGQGFDPDMALDRRGHLGLAGMLERAREIGWQLSVWSRPGGGACIHVAEKPVGSQHAAE